MTGAGGSVSAATVSLPFYDGFDYAEGNLNAVSGGNWIVGNGSTTFEIAVSNSAALTAPPGYPAASGKGVRRAPSGTARRSVLQFPSITAVDGNVIYVSFLLNVQTAPGSAQAILHLDNSSSSVTSPDLGFFVDNGPKVGIGKNASAPGFTMATNLGAGTHLIVGRYTFQSGNDKADLWVDPDTTDYGAATAPAPLGTHVNSGDPTTSIDYCQIVTSSGAGGSQYIDEFRLGTSWADVVPSGGPLIGAKLGFTTQPANAAPGATMSPVVVQVQTGAGVSVGSNGVPVTLTLTAGSGTLSGTLTQNTDSSGKATFSNLSINTAGTGKQLTATAGGIGAGLSNALSSTFSIVVPSVGSKLAFTTQPANALVNATMAAVVVQIQDQNSIAIASNNVPITLTLSGSGTLNGTVSQNTDSSGKATFSTLSIDTAGTGKQLTASASGIGAGLTNAVSGSFIISDLPSGGLQIVSEKMHSSGFILDGANTAPNDFVQVLGAVDPSADPANWIIVQYKNFDGGAHVTFTNPVSPAMPKAFYRLRTGDTTTKTQPPSIGIPPQSQIVSAGATATFTVTAVGPLLQYLWFFNGNPIPGATSDTLVIPNAQAANAGNYYVAVANPAGFVNSAIATLGIGNIAPTITSQPADEITTAGGTAVFNVSATGTSPLSYQWYFNTNTLLPGKTTTQLIIDPVSTNDAGRYSVNVSNAFGQVRSTNALLTISANPTAPPFTNLVGFAEGVTGGAGGTEVTVTDYASLRAACRQAGPVIIHIQDAIVANENYTYIDQPNKTIIGDGTNAAFYGDFRCNASNIIIANMYLVGTNHSDADGVTIDNSSSHGTGKYVWVDHCTFYNCKDGSVDVTKGADYVTISWCKFSYAPVPPGVVNHEFVNLIASSDSDNASQYHVTFHHNWYGDYCRERMPSVRFGRVHVFNNYYNCAGNNYCVRTRIDAQVLVENNYYIGVQNPWERFVTTGTAGLLKASGNITNNCIFVNGWTSGAVVIPGNDTLTDPSLTSNLYQYTNVLNATIDIPYYITTYAGSGKYPYAP